MALHLKLFFVATICALLISCIGDDIIDDRVDPELRLTSSVDTLALGTEFVFKVVYFNNVGVEESISNLSWTSSAPEIISIDNAGKAKALSLGSSTLKAQFQVPNGPILIESFVVHVGQTTIVSSSSRKGSLKTTSSYLLEGDFELSAKSEGVELVLASNYKASSSLPGLVVYLTNNPNSTANAFEIAPVKVFNGTHKYEIKNVKLNDYNYVLYYCKPFNVKIGDGLLGD